MGSDEGAVLVFGGTGRLGAPIVRLLAEAGHPVTVFARPTSNRDRLADLDVDYVTGDVLDAGSIIPALEGRGFRFVIDATAKDRGDTVFYESAMRNILAAVADSGVRQFILHGSAGAGDNMQAFPEIDFGRMRSVMIDKGRAEALLKDSGIDYTIIRNGRVMPDGTPPTGTARLTDNQAVLGTATRPDLAALTLQCLDNPACFNRTFHAIDESF